MNRHPIVDPAPEHDLERMPRRRSTMPLGESREPSHRNAIAQDPATRSVVHPVYRTVTDRRQRLQAVAREPSYEYAIGAHGRVDRRVFVGETVDANNAAAHPADHLVSG